MTMIKNALFKNVIGCISKNMLSSRIQVYKPQVLVTRKYSCELLMDPCSKVSLVIGGSSGVGLAVAHELLRNNAKHIYITGKNDAEGECALKELCERYGERTTFLKLDQMNFQQYEGVYKKTVEHGGADIVVNTEEIIRDKMWDYEVDLNMKGSIQGTLLAIKYMGPNKPNGGVVINLASTLGIDGFPYTPIYAGTKAGVIGFCRSIGDHSVFQDTKVRVIALCPGVTETNELHRIKDNQINKKWGARAYECLHNLPKQEGEHVARAVIYIVQNGPTGSVWVVEGAQILRTFMPERKIISETITCVG